ncbi:DUF4330 domain-containing protein [Caldisalinibacter kiritimatiensis]|uniref:DUF4330 domain-containing protein n=1 Tax=Caldisalinibacter kiritimatiensis TaxID=1304284 RepID=R1AQY5_9FIRM|nr:DUF4330 domain-containing protein [Caldisalinibacter kiritimatiensis]EOC99537.1 hypothetical protein L21TH_2449 [Caldisalinibacter kiritimatiensis]
MKLIDDKGKVFGIINVIDLTVLLILILLVVGGGYKVLNSQPQVVNKSENVVVKVEISGVRKPTVDGIKVGDFLYHYDRGNLFGKIVDKKVENYKEEVPTSDGKIVLADVPNKYRVILTVESSATITDQVTIIGGEHTRIGTQYRLKNKNVAVFSTVLGIEVK